MKRIFNKILILFSLLALAGIVFVLFEKGYKEKPALRFYSQEASLLENSISEPKKCNGSTFVICISKVLKLDEDKREIEDITGKVENKDDVWASIEKGQYVRIVFEKPLDGTNDISIFARTANWQEGQPGTRVEVYEEDNIKAIGEFNEIRQKRMQKFLLAGLTKKTSTFDLKAFGDIDIDYIVDPDTPGIAVNSGIKISGGVKVAAPVTPCASSYTPDGAGWAKTADTLVRDITGAYDSTIAKDIYCDDSNCILWTDGAAAPGTVCIATDANVYANILWAKTDEAGIHTWADSNFSISGGDIGGTHPAGLLVGAGGTDVSNTNWLARDYTSAAGTFNAMDACKAKGVGWRLPTILEFDSIRDQTNVEAPYTDLNGIVYNRYWSSSEVSTTNAYFPNFLIGEALSGPKSWTGGARCVRGAM